MDQFLADNDLDAGINVGADMRKIKHCFKLIKVFSFSPCPNMFWGKL